MAVTPPVCDFGAPIRDFTLPGTDGRDHSLAEQIGPRGTLVMFICNHCPYVQAVMDRITRDARDLQAAGIGVELDEEMAAGHPYAPAYLPVNRLADGTVHDW